MRLTMTRCSHKLLIQICNLRPFLYLKQGEQIYIEFVSGKHLVIPGTDSVDMPL